MIDHRGLAFSLLQARLPDVAGGPPIIMEGDISTRLPDLVPGLTVEVLTQLKDVVLQAASE